MPVPRIDHVVVDVGDRLDEAARRYRALGFNLTERSQHSLGSANQLAMLETDYLELLSPGSGARADLAGFPIGANGLVFALDDAESLHKTLSGRGVPVRPVQRFSRKVDLPDGESREARFQVVRLEPRTVFDGRVYFCQHLTPELLWRPEWQAHPNGALALTRVALAAGDPDRIADDFDRMFGAGAATRADTDGGPHLLQAGRVAVEIWRGAMLPRVLDGAMPDPAGRRDYMALVGIQVRSLQRAEEIFRSNGIRDARIEHDRILVPPVDAMNVTLEFVA